ncbi:MAG: phasin family protein [Legionellales bacterium]|nr:phasin family protein [Legionellales bacterium]
MQKEFIDQWTNFSKNSLEPFVAFNSLANESFERLAKQNLETVNDLFTSSVANLQKLADCKNVESLIATQTQILQEAGNKAIDYAQKSFAAAVDTTNKFSKLCEKNMSKVVSNVDKTVANKSDNQTARQK